LTAKTECDPLDRHDNQPAIISMSILEAALRGGAVAVLLLFVLLFVRDRDPRTSRLSRYTAFLFLGIAAFAVDSAPGFWTFDMRLKIPLHILSTATPAVFWIMAAALFDDEFKARWYHALAWLWLAGLSWREMYGWPPAIVAVHEASSLLFVALGVWHALIGRAGDLVEWRRQLRVEFAVTTALYIVLIIVSQRIWPGSLGKPPFSLFNAIGLMAFVFLFAWFRLSFVVKERFVLAALQGGSAPAAVAEPRQAPPATGQDAVLLEQLRNLMVEGKAYREDSLLVSHEAPRLTATGPVPYAPYDADRALENGMVISVETALLHPARGYIKLEDTLIVCEAGWEAPGDSCRKWNSSHSTQ